MTSVHFFFCATVADTEADGDCTLFILKSKVLLPNGLFLVTIVVLARSGKDPSKLSFLVNEQLSNICQLHRGCAYTDLAVFMACITP